MTRVSAVVLAHGDEPWLAACVDSVLRSSGIAVDVVLVDNAYTGDDLDAIAARDGVTLVRPPRNLGFSGGCNLGARRATGDVLAFVNADAVVDGDALRRLAAVACRDDVGIATASVRLADDPTRLNSGGNDIHFLGISWSGGFGESAEAHAVERDVAGASGAAMTIRREVWDELGGFDDAYFAYYEDAELSLRAWMSGRRVVYVPDAVVVHRYEFSRNPQKHYLAERNRLLLVVTLFEARTLLVLLPALLLLEIGMVVAATAGGWLGPKLSGWAWIVRNRRWVAERRRAVQRSRRRRDRELVGLFATRVTAANTPLPPGTGALNAVLAAYWRIARGLV